MTDSFWIQDINVLIDTNKLMDFFPNNSEPLSNRLNSIVRLAFYTSVIISLYRKNANFFYILLIVMIGTIIIYKKKEHLDNTINHKTSPTYNNPFMNFTMADYLNLDKDGNIKPRPKIEDPMNPKVKEDIEMKFNQGTFRDVSDLFNKNGSQRQFFTMPWTDAVNDREEFQNWLYKTDETCKENSQCLRYEDIRQNPPIFPFQEVNPSRIRK